MSDYRLILSDVDGTITDSRKCLPEENIRAIRAAADHGVQFAFATGRPFSSIASWVKQLGLTVPQLVNNGAQIVSPKGEVLYEACFPHHTARWLRDVIECAGFVPVVFIGAHGMVNRDFDSLKMLTVDRNHPIDIREGADLFTDDAQIIKITVLALPPRYKELDALAQKLINDGHPADVSYDACFSEPGILDVMPHGISKGTGLHQLCKICNISEAQVIAFGDGDNDITMIEAAGLGVAMANATPRVHKAANATTVSNDACGVAVKLHELGIA